MAAGMAATTAIPLRSGNRSGRCLNPKPFDAEKRQNCGKDADAVRHLTKACRPS